MFNFGTDGVTLLTEGLIGDSLKSASGLDTDKVKEEWEDASTRPQAVKDIGDAADKAASKLGKHTVDNRSIIARARNSVMQFPVYISQSTRVNEAHIISKLFERVYATLVQTVLSQNPLIDEDEVNNLVFLKKFHTNIKEAADVLTNKYYEPIDDVDRMMKESVFFSQRISENLYVEFTICNPADQIELITENARLINEPLSGFGYFIEKSTHSVETSTGNKEVTLTDDDLRELAVNRNNISARTAKIAAMSSKEAKDSNIDDNTLARARDTVADAIDKTKKEIQDGELGKKYQCKKGRFIRVDSTKSVKDIKSVDNQVPDPVKAPILLKDSDIKKVNGMLPYTMEATFRFRTKDGNVKDVRYVLGVKTVLHLIRTQDLADDLRELVTGNIKALQKVRYKTGEISFSDYFLNIKGIKADAAKNINYNKKWISTLKRLAEYNKLHGSVFKNTSQLMSMLNSGSVPIPNGTLILTQSDVTILTDQTGIDLSQVSNAKKLAKNLFLIGICIVDSSAGTMRVLFPDSDSSWDVQSLASIDAEIAKTDNSQFMNELKKMVNR